MLKNKEYWKGRKDAAVIIDNYLSKLIQESTVDDDEPMLIITDDKGFAKLEEMINKAKTEKLLLEKRGRKGLLR